MGWWEQVNGSPLDWLLEPDAGNPGPRYFALRDLTGLGADAPEVRAAQADVMRSGPVPAILDAEEPEGFWAKVNHTYSPKYRGTAWQIIFLAQLGADGQDERVRKGCEYLLSHAQSAIGGFSALAGRTPSGVIHCLNGNLCAALIDLGWFGDARLAAALDWEARSITGAGYSGIDAADPSSRYYLSGTSGPGFACAANTRLPCAWGAVKAALALAKVPPGQRTPLIDRAIGEAVEFLLSRDPAVADYPMGYTDKPSLSWFRFAYPLAYVTDVLQNLEALAALGCAGDPRLAGALRHVLDGQDAGGRWKLRNSYNGKMWVDIEVKGKPSKWITLRALRVLRAADATETFEVSRSPAPRG